MSRRIQSELFLITLSLFLFNNSAQINQILFELIFNISNLSRKKSTNIEER